MNTDLLSRIVLASASFVGCLSTALFCATLPYGTRRRQNTAHFAISLFCDGADRTVVSHEKVNGRGPGHVAEGLFKPLMAEWLSFRLKPIEFVVKSERVVSLGRFTGVHGVTGKWVKVNYAHVWMVNEHKITHFRQYIDTLAVAAARKA